MGFSHSEINYFIVHSVKFTADSDPASHVIACGNWPLIHTNQNYYGKPVEFFCRNLYESNIDSTFFLTSSIEARAIISHDKVCGQKVLTAKCRQYIYSTIGKDNFI